MKLMQIIQELILNDYIEHLKPTLIKTKKVVGLRKKKANRNLILKRCILFLKGRIRKRTFKLVLNKY